MFSIFLPKDFSVWKKTRQILQTICYKQKIIIIGLTLTYLDVDDCVAVHPHRKHGVLENNSDLIQQLLLQRCTVELLGGVGHRIQEDKVLFDVNLGHKSIPGVFICSGGLSENTFSYTVEFFSIKALSY